jgi:hypothetical protein
MICSLALMTGGMMNVSLNFKIVIHKANKYTKLHCEPTFVLSDQEKMAAILL